MLPILISFIYLIHLILILFSSPVFLFSSNLVIFLIFLFSQSFHHCNPSQFLPYSQFSLLSLQFLLRFLYPVHPFILSVMSLQSLIPTILSSILIFSSISTYLSLLPQLFPFFSILTPWSLWLSFCRSFSLFFILSHLHVRLLPPVSW